MKKLAHKLAFVMSLLLITALLPACSSKPAASGSGGNPQKKLGDVVVYTPFKTAFDCEGNAAYKAAKRYEELYGGKVSEVKVAYADYASTMRNMVSSGEAPDMALVYGGDMPGWALDILQPVEDYIDVSKLLHQEIVDAFRFKGHTYTLAISGLQTHFIWYNKSLLSQFGVEEMPYDMWKANNWTWESFKELAKQLTVDTNMDGKTDIWGFASNDPECFFYSNGAHLIDKKDDKWYVSWDTEAAMNVWNYTGEMWNTYMETTDLNNNGGFENGQIAMAHGTFEYAWARSTGMDVSEIGVAPYPAGPNFDGKYTCYTNFYGIPKTAKNPEGAAALAELLAEEEKKFPMGFDLGNAEAVACLDEQALEVVEYCSSRATLTMERGWGDFIATYMEAYNQIYNKGVNAKTALDSLKPKAQAYIDDMMK